MDYEIFELGDVTLQSGMTLRHAQLAYKGSRHKFPDRFR